MTTAAITVVVVGWLAGAVLLWRVRTPRATTVSGLAASVSVVIPARNEEHNLPRLLASLQAQTEPPLEVLVVDDDSVDRTAAVARAAGCVVVESGSPPPGWLGKPWACHQGAAVARGERLLFLDADTWLAPDGVARLAAAHQLAPDGLLSVQPFHAVERPYEQLSAVGNVVSVLASGMAGPAPRPSVAFGPCLLVRADVLAAVGGFETVRSEIVEDAALARAFRAAGRPVTCLGGGATVAFRMYPEGLSALVAGWTRSLAGGAGRVRRVAVDRCGAVGHGRAVGPPGRRHRAHGDGGGGVDRDGDAALVDAAPPRLVPLAHRGPVPDPAARLRGAVRVVLLHASGAAAGDVARAPGRDRFVMLPLLVDLSGWGLLAANVVGAGCVHAGTGYVAHRLPLDRLEHDGWLLAARPVERGGRVYERLRIRRWKDRLPEAGALFAGGVSKRRLAGDLERFAAETRRAEYGHWLAMAFAPVFALWNPLMGLVLMATYSVVVNAPFIAIQRYNRQRAQRVLTRRSRSTEVRARARRHPRPAAPTSKPF